ncbi:MAG: phosphoglycerate dehydrogenase [Candidatus Latescibacteria bacterium]|nr:phosphoglycerate dehydrogenase [Candidatus Latescibacterota bacterium]
MKVLISERLEPGCAAILSQRGIEVDQQPGLSAEELQRIIGQYEGLIVRSSTQVNEELLKAASRLKVVGRAGAGVDNIDVSAATRYGVIAMNTPGGNSVSTAEHSLAMLMSLARNIPQATASLKAGKWDRGRYTGVELAGKTIAVLGLGKVGREVALRAAAFKMKVLGYDPFVSAEMALGFGTLLAPLEQIWAEADFITVHLPLTTQTRHLISAPQLAQCKEGVFLLNCARGGILDEAELLAALNSGKVAGAALDVFVDEPPGLTPLVAHERVICTPHLGASTREAQATVALQIAEQVSDVLLNGVIRNAVNVPSVEPEVYQKLRPYIELAERLGRILAQLSEGQLERITVEYHGDVSAMPTSALTAAVLKGIMGNISDEPVNFVNAPLFAQQRGVRVDELKSSEHEDYASLISVIYQTDTSRRILSGTLFGKSDPRLVRLDEYSFDAIPEGNMLFYINDDVPGVIGRIGTVMGTHRVNIAQMSCGRHQVGGRALTILNVDSLIPDAVLAEILTHSNIVWAKQISL